MSFDLRSMKVSDWLVQATQRLIESASRTAMAGQPDIDGSPRLDAEQLLAHVLQRSRTWLYTWPDAEVEPDDAAHADGLLDRRMAGEPVAYLTGTREFWSLPFDVSPAVLIPRPETELLVEQALRMVQAEGNDCILELGTGSGAIAVALATECSSTIIATDRSADALRVARGNAHRLAPDRIAFVQCHWLDSIADNTVDLIISNPPYVAADDVHLRGTALAFEPRSALVAADAGLADIRAILQQCLRVARKPCTVMLEHGYEQGDSVRQLMHAAGLAGIATLTDLAGNERVTHGRC